MSHIFFPFLFNEIHQTLISVEPAYLSKDWIWAEMYWLWCLITYTLIIISQYFIDLIFLYDIYKISLSNWNQHINKPSGIKWNIYITDYVRQMFWYNPLSNISSSSIFWLIVTIFDISSIYCAHCVRFSINEPIHLEYFLYLHQIWYLWIFLYLTISLRAVVYPTLNYYY